MTLTVGLRQNLPYLNGIYIAVSAIRDAYLVVDGPYCVFQKAEIHSAHDINNSLISVTDTGRIIHTDLRFNTNVVYNVTVDRGHDIEKVLKKVSKFENAKIVFLTSMDFHHILSAPLEKYRRNAMQERCSPIILVESKSLEGDWLDGYGTLTQKVAENIDLGNPEPDINRVAIVGHLMDRNEGDQIGNLAEFKRILNGIGLELVSTWLNGEGIESLTGIRRAGYIISLPYARQAARILSSRLSIPVIETDLPVGLNSAGKFLRQIADRTERISQAEKFIDSELKRIIPEVKNHIFRYLAGRSAIIQQDPFLAKSMVSLFDELGMRCKEILITGQKSNLSPEDLSFFTERKAVFEPEINNRGQVSDERDFDVLIAGTLFPCFLKTASWIPFGYPNYFYHPVTPQPFIGYNGFYFWIQRLTEAVLQADLRRGEIPPDRTTE
jgi:nitrogenase molybdenum-iron protein alpha/beta subunit